MTAQLARFADQWRVTLGRTDEQLAAMIRQDEIDLLVDLSMHMAGSRLLAFARKPAPVQVTYLAYCGTTGLETMDYRLTDPWLDPPGDPSAGCYVEKSVYLPVSYWCYGKSADAPAVGPLPARSAGHVTFGCLNNFTKVTAPTIESWRRILAALPGSRLIVHAGEGTHRQVFRDRMAADGVERGRIEFSGFLSPEQYFAQYNRIDVALDPFPYAGGTTTCDALWMGVPVVSLAGATAVSRAGLSILSNLGLPELVSRTTHDYEKKAVDLALDLPRLQGLRQGLRARMEKSPLMDATRFAHDVEGAFEEMCKR